MQLSELWAVLCCPVIPASHPVPSPQSSLGISTACSHWSTFCHYGFAFSRNWYKWKYTVCSLWCLVSLIAYLSFSILLVVSVIPFYGWILGHYIPFCLSIHIWWTFGLAAVWAIMNTIAFELLFVSFIFFLKLNYMVLKIKEMYCLGSFAINMLIGNSHLQFILW